MAGYGSKAAEHGEVVFAHGEGVRQLDRCFAESLGNDGRIDERECHLLRDLIGHISASFTAVHRGAEEAHARETLSALVMRRGVTPWFVRQVTEQARDLELLVGVEADEQIAA